MDNADNTLTITVTTLPTLGTVTLANGTAVALNQVLTIAQLEGLQYDAPADYNGTDNPGDFIYTVSDGSETISQAVDFDLTSINDAAALDLDDDNDSGAGASNYRATFTEDDGAIAITDTDATLTDVDNTDLESLTVVITNLLDGTAESLSVDGTLPTGISSNYNSGTGTLTLTGTASVANYLVALKQIRYNNTSEDPDETDRSITVIANDGSVDSNTATATLTIVAEDDAIVLDLDANDNSGAAGADYETDFTEGDTDLAIADSDVSITDVDGTELTQVAVALTNRPDGTAEDLGISGTLPSGITVTEPYDNADGQLVLSGNASLADYQTALQQIRYNNSSENPNETDRVVTVVADNSGTASNTGTTTLSVAGINDAPVTNNGVVTITADEEEENVPLTLAAPTDVDDATLTITVISLPNLGTLTLADGTAVTLNQELTIAQLTGLQYDAPLDYDGVATENDFEYEVSDGDETVSQLVSFDLSAVNDAPVVSAQSVLEDTNEETALVFNATNSNALSISDADGDNQTVTITATNGTVSLSQLTGLTFTTGDGVEDGTLEFSGSLADINAALAGASFLPNVDYVGPASLLLETDDAQGGTDDETVAINVIDVNDAPVVDLDAATGGNDYATSFDEGDTDVTIAKSDASIADVDDTQLTSLTVVLANRPDGTDESLSVSGTLPSGITVTDSYDNADGQLVLSGAASVADYQTALRQVVYNNNSDTPDETDRSITVLANDGDDNSTTATTALDVNAVNDAPISNNADPVEIDADEEEANVLLNLSAPSDVDNDDNTLTITVTTLPTLGTVTLANGTAVALNQVLTIAQLEGLQYDAPADYNGTDNPGDFIYTVSDGSETISQTVDFDLTSINDAAVSSAESTTESTDEDTNLVFNATNSNEISVADVDGDNQTMTITATNGTFSLSQLTGLTFTTGDGTEDGTMTFSGSLTDINAALLNATFIPAENYFGSDGK